eukprot:CAMPEP_0168509710 /NCGR_PEP_ID=MMETSP0405-20121227/963_1 /TAXON_ID=498012 /ORGANISM="Trichosphaerium sp, Strain Am-I-7 wt" /LENGTH=375 /DNA_ID=CAMNT_0008527271 /DNA_START=1593 /DNA_END=2717 /DNA_ORIENTATION=+
MSDEDTSLRAKIMSDPAGKTTMKYNYLGNSGVKVSEICMGTMTFGNAKNMDYNLPTISTEESFALMDKFVEAGGNFFDTANIYGKGESERVVGKWIKARNNRDQIVLATKGFFRMGGKGPNNVGYNRSFIIRCLNESLERLDVDYIDLYQLHGFDAGTPVRELLRTLHSLVMEGKIRYIGISNWPAWAVQNAMNIARYENMTCFVSLQAQYSLLSRSAEYELFPCCRANNVAYLPWSPLKGGWLSGRYVRGMKKPEDGRVAWAEKVGWKETAWSNLANEHTWGTIDALKKISEDIKRPVAQVALRWVMQRPGVTSTLIGARKMRHLLDNLGTTEFTLTDEQMQALNKASSNPLPYPYNLIEGTGTMHGRSRDDRT